LPICPTTTSSLEICKSVNPNAKTHGPRSCGGGVQPTSSAPPPPEMTNDVGITFELKMLQIVIRHCGAATENPTAQSTLDYREAVHCCTGDDVPQALKNGVVRDFASSASSHCCCSSCCCLVSTKLHGQRSCPLLPGIFESRPDECEKRVLLQKLQAVPASWHCQSSALPGICKLSFNFVPAESLVIVVAKHSVCGAGKQR
jgi:hypothetical protein